MGDTKIITNNVPRPIIYGHELTPEEKSEFDYIKWNDGSNHEFFRYKGTLYDMSEFFSTRGLPESSPMRAWDGYQTDSFFSATIIRYVRPDYDHVVVGLALS